MKSKLMVLLSIVLAVILSSCAPGGESYSHTTYQGRLENGIWESASISFSQDGKTYDNEVVQISVDNENVTFKFKNANIVSRSTSYGEDNMLVDPYNPERNIIVAVNYVNDELSSFEISGGFFLRGISSSFVITKVSSTPEKWEENYKPVADLNDFEFEDNENGVTLIKYNGDDPYLIVPSTIEGKAVTEIASGAFVGSSYSSSPVSAPYDIVLPDTLITINDGAFQKIGVRTMTIPDSVTTFGKAFLDCTELEELKIGAGVSEWPEDYIITLNNIEISPANTSLKAENGLIMSKDGSKLFVYLGSASEDLIIPSTIREVSEYCFNGKSTLDTITIEDNEGVEFPNNTVMTSTEMNIINSKVTFTGTLSVRDIEIRDKSNVKGVISAYNSLMIDSSSFSGNGSAPEISINNSEITGKVSAFSGFQSESNSIKITSSKISGVSVNGGKMLNRIDMTGSSFETLYVSIDETSNPIEIILPNAITTELDINIGQDVSGKITIPYIETYQTLNNDGKWQFVIEADESKVDVTIDEQYGTEIPYRR